MNVHHRPLFAVPIATLLLAALVQPACAADIDEVVQPRTETDPRLGLGVAMTVKRSLYGGVGTEVSAIPLISYENRWIRAFGNVLDAKLLAVGNFDFALRVKYSGDGYKSSDSDELEGMHKRRDGLWAGVSANWRSPAVVVTSSWMHDASSHSKGSEINLGIERTFKVTGSMTLTPYLGVQRQDRKSVDYYFGVEADEATAARPEYSGKAATNFSGGAILGYSLTRQQNLLLDVQWKHYGSEVTDSPIVGHDSVPQVRIGYLYRF